MKEKVYRQAQFYGKLTTVTCQEYYLLAPLPVPGDDWQLEHQQTWYVVPNEIVDQVKVNGEYKTSLDTRVAVLMGGPSAEREISLKSGKAVLNALQNMGVKAVVAISITN